MKVCLVCMIVAFFTQEIRLRMLERKYDELLDRVLSIARIQARMAGRVKDLCKDLWEREAQYD